VGDVRDRLALEAVLRDYKFDVVMHFAGLAYVGESVSDPGPYYDVNVGGTRTLLDAMVSSGVGLIVFSSTCAVYGEPTALPITERTPLAPINPYGFSKLVCERMMDDFEAAYGIKSVRLRYFNAAGADPDGEIGEDHNPETHLIPLVLETAIGRRPAISVFGVNHATPDGTAIRDYIHVTDLASAHIKALNHILARGRSLALNLGVGRGVSVGEIIASVEKITQQSVKIDVLERSRGDPSSLIADPSEAHARIGWTAQRINIEEILRDAWAWHLRRAG
jgi:UDP-glucose 4-epimerase